MSRLRRLWVARFALTAMLFGALSPALASVLFADRPHLLARVLALPMATAANLPGAICQTPDAASASAVNPATDGNSEHTAHGVLCSFCLPAGAGVALPSLAAVPAIKLALRNTVIPTAAPRGPAVLLSTHHARGPPAVLN